MLNPMKRYLFGLILVSLLGLPGCQQAPAQVAADQAAQSLPPIQVYFSPKGGCTEAVVKELNAAKTSVLVQAYSFTSAPIAKALLAAHKRGVKVQVILDKSQKTEKYSEADFLVNVGIPDARSTPSTPSPTTRSWSSTARRSSPGQLQFHHGRRRAQRREPAGDPLPGTGGKVRGQLESSCRPFRSLRRAHGGLLPDAPGGRLPSRRARARAPAYRGLCRVEELAGLPPGGLQVGGQDFGEEPGPLPIAGRGDSGRQEAMRGVQAVVRHEKTFL